MKNILCLLLLAGTFAARAQTPVNDLLHHIPADADQVIDINLGALSSKIDIPSVVAMIGGHSKDKSFSIVQHLLTSGVDLHQNMMVIQTNSKNPDSTRYVTFLLHITDSAKFAAFIRANGKEGVGEPLHYLHPPGKQRVAVRGHEMDAWTDKLAVLLVETPSTHATATPQARALTQTKGAHRAAAALAGFANTKFITNEHFATVFSDDGDVHIWSHHNQLASLAGKLGKMSPGMAQLGMLSQMAGQNKGKSESIATLRFDNGSIRYSTFKFLSPDQIAATRRALGQGLSPELLAIVPPRQLIGVASAHIDMGVVEDSLKKMPSFGMIDTMAQSKGIHIWDIIHALKGDFMLLVCSPDKPATTDSTGKTKMPAPSMYLLASITSKDAFEKVVPTVKLKDATSAGADTTTTDTAHSKNPFPYYLLQNDLVVFGKRQRVNEFFTPGNAVDPVGKLLPEADTRAGALNIVLDFHALADDLLAPTLNTPDASSKDKAVLDALRNLQTLQISVGTIQGDAMETRVELNFTDKSKNSLTTLMNMVGSLSQK
ncbi:MAG TPA: DUF4836 family protein [Puia sp.]|nr:DUF4836 family protein [Puia sp.]